MRWFGLIVVVATLVVVVGYGSILGSVGLEAKSTAESLMCSYSERDYHSGLKSKGNQVQSEKSKKTSLTPSSKLVVKQPSLNHLTKQLATNASYKGYEIKVMYKHAHEVSGMRGYIAIARKNNVYVVGAEPNGRMVTSQNEPTALAHICSLIDLDEGYSDPHLKRETIESIFND